MALEAKQKIYVKTRANFDTLLTEGTIGTNHLVFIEDTNEIWTHGKFFSGRSFKSVTDGTNTASSPSTSGMLTFTGDGKVSVTVGTNGVTITGANADVATGDNNGQVKIDGQNVSVKGLGSAAYTESTAYATAAQGTAAETHASATNNPHNVTAAQVGLGNVTNESKATMFTNAALTGVPTAPTAAANTNSTQIATTAYVDSAVSSLIGASDAMVFKGTLGTGGTATALPTTYKVGDTYKVITAGTYAGAVCEVGDLVICITTCTTAANAKNADWTVAQANIDGAVTGPASSTAGHIATFGGATGKVIADSGYTIETSVPENALFTDESVTSAANHYAPEADANSEITATAGTAGAYALNTEYEVVTGVKAQRDAKGHVTGMTVTTQKVKDTHVTPGDKALKIASNSGTATTAITTNEGSADKTLTVEGDGTWITGAVSGSAGAAKVTLSHGGPGEGSAISTTNGTAAAYTLGTEYEVVTGVTVQADSKGHITGVSTTRQKVKDTHPTVGNGALNIASDSGTAVEATTMNESASRTIKIKGDGTWTTGAVSEVSGVATVTLSHANADTEHASALTTTEDGETAASVDNTDVAVITGVTVSADAKGHITGVTTTRKKVKNTTYTTTEGSGIDISAGRVITNTGVRSIGTGTTNGTISVKTNETTAEVSVAGLGTAAFKDEGHFDLNGAAAAAEAAAKAYADDITVNGQRQDSNQNIALNATHLTIAAGYSTGAGNVAASDTIQAAIGKLEYKIDSAVSDSSWAEYN